MIQKIKQEIKKSIIGHEALIDAMLVALFSGGHLYIEGPPGVAKTTAVKALASILGFSFHRVQFTPDLLPADITGAEVLDLRDNSFRIRKGPIFANIILADEINRAGAKVQSALLEAMAERQVTIAEKSFKLPEPFMVLATANPLEQEGTFELPEASLDRFMMKVVVDYNSKYEEMEIAKKVNNREFQTPRQLLDIDSFNDLKRELEEVFVDDKILEYMADIVQATRYPNKYGIDTLSEMIEHGAGTRAVIDLYGSSRAYAWINGRDFVTPADIATASYGVLTHRIKASYRAVAKRMDTIDMIRIILSKIPAP